MKQRESKIRAELERLARRNGGELRPEVVVEAARPDTSPLHNSFDWDDSSAAQQWRLQQARMLIRAVVTYEHVDAKEPTRVFVSLTTDRNKDGAGYRLTTAVMGDDEQRTQLLADALGEMNSFREKYRRLNELSKVFAAMEAVEASEQVEEVMTPIAASA